MDNKRNYGIDLLRLVLMFMVCMLHTLGQGGILTALTPGTAPYQVYWLLEVLCFCAVDGFAMISGYTASDKPPRYSRIVEMWLQVFFYSLVLTVLLSLAGMEVNWTRSTVLAYSLPVTYNVFWYFTGYFVLFFAAPLLNRYLLDVDEAAARKAFLFLVLLFTVAGAISDAFRTHAGYSAIWIIVLYCMGVLARRGRLFERRRTICLIAGFILCGLISWAFFLQSGLSVLISYTSPTMVLGALALIVVFSRLSLRGTVIRKLSPLAFGIYLFQLSPAVWHGILGGATVFLLSKPLAVGVAGAFACGALIFLCGLAVEFVRSLLARLLQIPRLSRGIVTAADRILTKLSSVLK